MIRKTFNIQVLPDTEAKQLFASVKKVYNCDLKGTDVNDTRTITLKISTANPDRSKDVVNPQGMNADNFVNNPVVAAFHQYNQPAVGRAIQLGVGDDFVVSKMEFTPEGMNPTADVLHNLYKSGFQHAASIGFIPTDKQMNDNGGYDFKSWELLEYSLVLVPDNPEALTIMRSKGLDPDKILAEQKTVEEQAELKGAIAYKETPKAPKDQAWDAGEQVKAATVDDLKVMCAWVDSENADNKGAYKLPHHEAAGEHAVVWNGVKAAGAAIDGARGGTDIPDGDVAGVKAHLAKHYAEFDETPPWESKDDGGKSVTDATNKAQKDDRPTDEQKLPAGDEDNQGNPGYNVDTKVSDMTAGELADLIDRCLDAEESENDDKDDSDESDSADDGKTIAGKPVKKDVDDVIALAQVLDCLSFFIWCFEQDDDFPQTSLDKLNQALGLVLQVVQEQAVLGEKSYSLKDLKIKDSVRILAKAGRTISGKHEEMLKSACDHMGQATDQVKGVLDTVNGQAPSNEEGGMFDSDTVVPASDDDGKSIVSNDYLHKLANALKLTNQKQDAMLREQKSQTSTLSSLKRIAGVKGGE